MRTALPPRVRIGAFELDLRSGELCPAGEAGQPTHKVLLQEQPFQVLRMLVERAGELTPREDIQKRLWPNDTIVEFDHCINVAIGSLRRALGDSANEPKYVETVARRGYRLIGRVEPVGGEESSGEVPSLLPKASDEAEALVSIGGEGGAVHMQTDAAGLIGKRVSHYRVLEVLGGGGMGLVYKAEDIKLGRRVALKFLPEELATDSVTLQRFDREARTASSLNHPNICTIYEIEEYEDQPFIVMELLGGETLRDRLAAAEGGLPLAETLDVAIQVGNGLQGAHELGIIHRDIKPANIFITNKGVCKILDFGLAKLVEASEGQPRGEAPESRPAVWQGDSKGHGFSRADNTASSKSRMLQPQTRLEHTRDKAIVSNGTPEGVPFQRQGTRDATLTNTGLAMGTAGYMSPEQARGEHLDARTDLFSFGLVLYEMATGQRAFSGDTAAVVHDAILNKTPVPVHDLNSQLPSELGTIVTKALEKDRSRRYQHATELRSDLQRLKSDFESVSRSEVVPREAPGRRGKQWKAILPAAIVFIVVAAVSFFYFHRSPKLTDKDTVVLADFINTTGDSVFDETLKTALDIALRQSPFLNALSADQVTKTLQEMTRPVGSNLTPEVAQEICLRRNSKAYIAGSIGNLGSEYVLGLKAVNCHGGETLAEEQVTSPSKEKVLNSLGDAAAKLRGELGESLATVQKYDAPLQEATTASFEALQAYTLGMRMLQEKSAFDALPYFQRAVALDPHFALAYADLGAIYYAQWDMTRAKQNYVKAYELRDRVSQRERFLIEGAYYRDVTGDLEKAKQSLTQMIQMYPADYAAHKNLAGTYFLLGQYANAVTDYQQAQQLAPEEPTTGLAKSYTALGRWDEAVAAYKKLALPHNETIRYRRYWLAFAQGDDATMREQIALAVGSRGEEGPLLYAQSRAEGYHGRLAKASATLQRALDLARRDGESEAAAGWKTDDALRDAEIGNPAQARRKTADALQLSHGKDVRIAASLTLTRTGDPAKGRELAQELNEEFPVDTLLQGYWLPTIAAASEMRQDNPSKALDLLSAALPYEMCEHGAPIPNYYAAYLRGLAYLRLGQGENAAREFQKILDHPGIVWAGITGALARLGLARAYGLDAAADPAARDKARTAYQDFLTLWKDADPDIPIYKQAKAEYAKLR